jgi:hypothetical protein
MATAESRGALIARRLFTAIAAVEYTVAMYVILFGGFRLEGPVRISASDPSQPFTIGTVAAALGLWLSDRRSGQTGWDAIPRWARVAAAVAAIVTVLAGLRWAVRVAGGADAFGYVSQASLWVKGALVVPEPLATLEPSLTRSAAPLGYIPAQIPGANVPVYPPGLPLTMAAALLIGRTADAVYVVVPLLGGLAVWWTFLLGERLAGPRTGLLAALLSASSPMFLFHLFEPMSDLPVTAWWLGAAVAALGPSSSSALASGLAAAAAVLTRPNLVPLAPIVAALVALRRPPGRRVVLFTAGIVPGCVAVAVINQWLYGSPFKSGYGPLTLLFGLDWFWPNLKRYPRWLMDLHTPGILLALAAPFLLRRGQDVDDGGVRDTRALWLILLFCMAILALYLFYLVFPDWPALRFLLPAIPFLFVLASAAVVRGLVMLPSALRGASALALCGLLGCWYVQKADRLGVFLIQESQRRYVTVGEFAKRQLPDGAFLALIQSGTMRWYGDRPTLRWDQLQPEELDSAIAALRQHGMKPYLLLEDGEERAFREHFAEASPLGLLDWAPAYELASQPRVRIYDPEDRRRYVSGETVLTRAIGNSGG